jgi:hypothetical protein
LTGELKKEVLSAVLDAMPVEMSFVDENDTVRYFNKNGNRIFPRPPAVIGKKVQDCHPKTSLHKVNQMLDDFKNNRRNSAEFWIDLKNRKVYIRYFAVRDKDGKYLGCLEVTQDITDIQKIEGEKRLL